MKYYVYLSKNKIDMLYDQLETEEYEEENTIGFDFKIVKGETKTKSNTKDNIYQKVKCVSNALKNECGNIEQDFPYIQCNMKLNCCYYDVGVQQNVVYWGGIELINDTLYVLYMTCSISNMLFVKSEDSIKEVKHYNFSSDYSGLLLAMESFKKGISYSRNEEVDKELDVGFLLIAKALNIDGENKFLEYNFMARVFRREFVDIDKYKGLDLYGEQILKMFDGYEYNKICVIYASPLYISL